jgi:Na+-transporting NADH:ubiquinone oxidoreductase subunit NqrE
VSILKVANLALSFFLELCMVLAYGYWGFKTGNGLVIQFLLGIGVPLVVIVIWGIFLAPASKQRLQGVPHWMLEIILFVAAIVALFVAGQPTWATIFAVLYAINVTLRLVWKQ